MRFFGPKEDGRELFITLIIDCAVCRIVTKDFPWYLGWFVCNFYSLLRAAFSTAAIIATFRENTCCFISNIFGNPTYVPIGVISLQTGHFFLGTDYIPSAEGGKSILEKFLDAGADLQQNVLAFVKGMETDWSRLEIFYQEVFFPYMIGGIIPGLIMATLGYYLSEPIIRAYQNRRKGFLLKKLRAVKSRSSEKTGKKK